MGLISAAVGAASGVLADTWRDYFYQEAIDNDTLMIKGEKKVGGRGSNKKGSDNLISDGSIISVADGQCMIVVEQGAVKDVCAEPGDFLYSNDTEPSLFYGNLGENIKKTFEQFKRRFSFGGGTGKDSRVYYFNIKEIVGNKYGTVNPIPFRAVDPNIGLDVEISLKCHGEYAYRIVDPILFYKNLSGNVSDIFNKGSIDSQMRSDLLTALQPAFGRLSDLGIRYYSIVNHTMELSNELNSILSSSWGSRYGIEISSFGISSIEAPKEDQELIKQLQRAAVFKNPNMAAANLTAAQADAMKAAASNTSAGPMMAFAGMNMAAQAGGVNANQLYQMGANQTAGAGMQPNNAVPQGAGMQTNNINTAIPGNQAANNADGTWVCSHGHSGNTGKFCSECGEPRAAKSYRCSSCGYVPADPSNPPKFCPECGNAFGDEDLR